MGGEFDLVVIGMGVGGEEVARRAAEGGLDVVAVEKKLVGGECPYWACIPTKVMVRAADSLAEAMRVTGLAGDSRISPDWAPVARRVREVTAGWDDQIAVERHEDLGTRVVRGTARFIGPREIDVDGQRFRARKGIVIATGTSPEVPQIEGLDEIAFWTNREAVEATEVPSSMVVVGAGPVGLEIGQVFSRFGCEVTLVERSDRILAAEEPENSAALQEVLTSEGIRVLTGVDAEGVSHDGDRVQVALSDGNSVGSERLLVAVGRTPNLDLGLEAAGVEPEGRAIAVDAHMRAGEGIWAVGDITAVAPFTHMAVYQGRIAAADILGHPHDEADYSAIPRVTFTDPEVAGVGMSEEKARAEGISVRTGVSSTKSSSRGYVHGPGAGSGVIKVIGDADAGVLVGASVMGPAAGEIIGLLTLAIKERIPVSSLRELIYPYPTFVRGVEDALRDLAEA